MNLLIILTSMLFATIFIMNSVYQRMALREAIEAKKRIIADLERRWGSLK